MEEGKRGRTDAGVAKERKQYDLSIYLSIYLLSI